MAKLVIMANFYDGCTVIRDSKIIASGVGYETAKLEVDTNGGEIWQEYMSKSGYKGLTRRDYKINGYDFEDPKVSDEDTNNEIEDITDDVMTWLQD